jgi:hypothetical protein
MTTETTTHSEIGKQLERLTNHRRRVQEIDHVLRWVDERKRGLSSANEITCNAEFRRKHTSTKPNQYSQIAKLPPSMYPAVLLLAKDHWAGMILPLEAWLDARKIEHVESAKPD